MTESDIEKMKAARIAEAIARFGDCFMCRFHNTIECRCRVGGALVEYPKKGCPKKDYPWGNPAEK